CLTVVVLLFLHPNTTDNVTTTATTTKQLITIAAISPPERELEDVDPVVTPPARTIAKYTPEAGTIPVAVVLESVTSDNPNGAPTVNCPLLFTARAKSATVYAGLMGIVGLMVMVRLLGYVTFPLPVSGNTAPDMICPITLPLESLTISYGELLGVR